jgi:hypothetical protein
MAAPRTERRNCSTTSVQQERLALSLSRSIVMSMTPLADPGLRQALESGRRFITASQHDAPVK